MYKPPNSDLKEADENFSLVLASPHPEWIFDHETLQFLEVNSAAISKYGFSRNEFLKMKITDIRPRNQVPQLLATHKKFQMNRKHFGEWQHVLKDGRVIDVEITAYPLYFAGRKAVLVQAQDVTERKETQNALRQLAIVEERNRIAREIHDTLAQSFTGILIQLEAAQDVLKKGSGKARAHIVRARTLARESLAEARRSLWALHPRELEKGSLAAAIKRIAQRSNSNGTSIDCFVSGKAQAVSNEIRTNVLRISQEGLTNTIRHANATKVKIRLIFRKRSLELILQDNGRGFTHNNSVNGLGLISMKERAERIAANLVISSRPGQGTKITLKVPLGS